LQSRAQRAPRKGAVGGNRARPYGTLDSFLRHICKAASDSYRSNYLSWRGPR